MNLSNNALIRVLSNLVALVFLEEHDDFFNFIKFEDEYIHCMETFFFFFAAKHRFFCIKIRVAPCKI